MTYAVDVACLVLAVFTLPGTLELLLVTLGAVFSQRHRQKTSNKTFATGSIAVIIPAHNEEQHIAETIMSLKKCEDPLKDTNIIVIADNCNDKTSSIAENQGARIITRQDRHHQGKGYALNHAFEILLQEKYECFIVVDADSVVDENFLVEVRKGFSGNVDALQAVYTVLNENDSYRTRIMQLALSAFNVVRPKGRQFWGLSAGIFGNGFALRRRVLENVPYHANSLVEDLEYHLQLVKANLHVGFLENTSVKSIMPSQGKVAASQRVRWEAGRMQIMRKLIVSLVKEIVTGHYRLIEPLLELLLLPLSFHTLLLCVGLLSSSMILKSYFIIAGVVLGMHFGVAVKQTKRKLSNTVSILLILPLYVLWKLTLLPNYFLKNLRWERTVREK